jgi:SAM-dependent methyltransferase
MDINKYTRWAEYYDLDPRNLYTDDIPFYIERARRSGGPILELGCGSGRVTLPLAEAGFHITGIDHSPSMLEVFKRKCEALPPAQREKLAFEQADMTNFTFRKTFGLIIIPFRSFQALAKRSDQESCLASVKAHLAPDGEFIFDVFRPKKQLDESWVRPEQKDWSAFEPRTGRTVSRHSKQKSIDTKNQILDIDVRFVISEEAGPVDSFTEPLRLSYFHEEQLVALVESAGLRVTEKFGYYDGTPVNKGSELIFVCKHIH